LRQATRMTEPQTDNRLRIHPRIACVLPLLGTSFRQIERRNKSESGGLAEGRSHLSANDRLHTKSASRVLPTSGYGQPYHSRCSIGRWAKLVPVPAGNARRIQFWEEAECTGFDRYWRVTDGVASPVAADDSSAAQGMVIFRNYRHHSNELVV